VDVRAQVRAVESYLMAHHAYSLSTDPGTGDPVANFLGSDKAAHCEYFASAAVVLLRCLGLPTRYCIGYYVHEKDGDDTIVRLRDAHAWAECYVEGPNGGWLTVEATPGGARPGESGEPVPFWQKLRERISDAVTDVRRDVIALAKVPRIGCVWGVVLCLTIMAAGLRRWYLQARKRIAEELTYASRSRELAQASRLFERWLKRVSKSNSPHPRPVRTWREDLGAPVLENHALAREWLRLYDAARFGPQTSDTATDELARLRVLLAQIERSTVEIQIPGENHETAGKRVVRG
jgi:hypothetical protein